MHQILIKRIYDTPMAEDGYRVLVDRLWPRGVSKERAALGTWAKEISPSNELRKSVHAESITWKEFDKLYKKELKENAQFVPWRDEILKKLATENICFLTSTQLTPNGHPYILKQVLLEEIE